MMCILCHEREPVGRSFACGICFGGVRRDLITVQWAHGWLLAEMLAPPAAFRPGNLHAAAGSRPPFNLNQHDVRASIEAVVGSWARMISEEHVPALAGPASGKLPVVVTWLHARLPWCSDQSWFDELARELHELRQKAYSAAPWGRAREDKPLPCPSCGLLTLAQFSGDEWVMCRNELCQQAFTLAEYHGEVSAWWERANSRREVMAA